MGQSTCVYRHETDDERRPLARLLGPDQRVAPDRYPLLPVRPPRLGDIDLAAGRMDPDTEALYFVVPEDVLTFPGFEGVDASFGDLGHCTHRFSLPVGEQHGYPQDANRSVL